jgi:hypothetical protein
MLAIVHEPNHYETCCRSNQKGERPGINGVLATEHKEETRYVGRKQGSRPPLFGGDLG